MKLTYLGTAASEGFPAVFCNCDFCKEARELKGKNIRTRSQAIVNDDLLLDFPPDTYYHFLENDIRGDKIKYLFITHPHHDHFYFEDLLIRHSYYAHNRDTDTLKVFCPKVVYETFKVQGIPEKVEVKVIKEFETVSLPEYEIVALPAKHNPKGALIYIIKGDKTLLYAHDTGYFFEDVFEYIDKNKIKFDMISIDCTNVDIDIDDNGRHMGLPNVKRVLKRLEDINSINKYSEVYINHFSHNGNPLHHILEDKVKGTGIKVAYDGCVVEI